jgi:chromosome segregation ATPase
VKLFSGQISELKTMNRILTEAARKRAERVEELELELGHVKSDYILRIRRVEELELKLQHHERAQAEARKLERELTEAATKRALRIQELERELTEVGTERASRIHELERELTKVAAKLGLRIQELERELTEAVTKNALRIQELERLEAEGAFYRRQTGELVQHNAQLTDAATKCSLRVQELERELLAARTEIATIDYPSLEAQRAFYRQRANELEQHNRQLTEAATKYALRVQELEQELRAARPEIATNE